MAVRCNFFSKTADPVVSTLCQGKIVEAESVVERAQAVYEKSRGPEHLDVATTIVYRAGLLQSLMHAW